MRLHLRESLSDLGIGELLRILRALGDPLSAAGTGRVVADRPDGLPGRELRIELLAHFHRTQTQVHVRDKSCADLREPGSLRLVGDLLQVPGLASTPQVGWAVGIAEGSNVHVDGVRYVIAIQVCNELLRQVWLPQSQAIALAERVLPLH